MRNIIFFCLLTVLLVSCSESNDGNIVNLNNNRSTCINLNTDLKLLNFDTTNTENSNQTRATDKEIWNDNNILYIYFQNGDNQFFAYATYNTANGWNLILDDNLSIGENGICRIYFIQNAKKTNKEEILLGDSSIIYKTDEGFYNIDKNICYISGTLTPTTTRLKFIDALPNDSIFVNGLSRENIFYIKSGKISYDNSTKLLVANKDSTTSYLYCIPSEKELKIINGDSIYSRSIYSNILQIGHSGTMSLSQNILQKKWSRVNAIEYFAQEEYVDLGLSVYWSTKNLGASYPYEDGDYYVWGNNVPYEQNSNYAGAKDRTQEDICGTDRDPATYTLGSNWHMPNYYTESDELFRKCMYRKTSYKGKNGYVIISKINGARIFLPNTGIKDSKYGSLKDTDDIHYWTGSHTAIVPSDYGYAMVMTTNINSGYNICNYCRYGMAVRPVHSK